MIIKKLLIVKPKVIEFKNGNGEVIRAHYDYPKHYNAEHAKHICYNFANGNKLKGGHLAEGMVIYEAEEEEIRSLLKEDGVEIISYSKAIAKGKKWKPKMTVYTFKDGVKKEEFDIRNWIKDKTEINNKKLT